MPLKEATLQRQLEVAQKERAAIESQFEGLEPKKQPMWRKANATVENIELRLSKAKSRSANTSEDDS
ncbi:hypothetical protein [Thalassoglobus polymorphus]|uniref:Uncharacterized protein n=1 Tax=Thalassoglobus polymorphus TaxID=2527994 RepID=A0A517QNG5_9PLAN|nr:hypothetical protein [Thalassoglobus polymorphus]QDT33172.1 hypothetical protein Mal48_24250 [Thalassoglobus polymorphus]